MANESLRIDRSLSFKSQSPPPNPLLGEIYFPGILPLLQWDGSSWVPLSGGGGGSGSTVSASYYLTSNAVIGGAGDFQLTGFTQIWDTNAAFSSDQFTAPFSGFY